MTSSGQQDKYGRKMDIPFKDQHDLSHSSQVRQALDEQVFKKKEGKILAEQDQRQEELDIISQVR